VHPPQNRIGQPGNSLFAGFCLLGLALAGTLTYAKLGSEVNAIEQWLFWPLAALWGWVATLNLACVSFGQLVIVRVLKLRNLSALESAVFAMAVGLVCFVIALYIGGALAWFTPVFAVALPVTMFAVSAPYGIALFKQLIRAAANTHRTPFTFALICAGSMCAGIVYLGALTPDSLNYDSTWCHLTVSQDYARAGRIIAFPADYTKNMPQLASMIHTWGFIVPGLTTPLRYMLVLHNEFGIFLWTLAGVAAGIRRMLNDQRVAGSWAAFFLFPIIFVYDHNLGGAADHICAFFAVPMVLATLRMLRGFRFGDAILLGVVSAGGLATKYQAAYLIVGIAMVLGAVWPVRLSQLRRQGAPQQVLREVLWAPLLTAAVAALCVSPHFIRQAIFHKNPLYPFLQDVIPSWPSVPNAAFLFKNTISDPNWIPKGTLLERLCYATKLFWTFSFHPHYSFTRNMPAFGSLFTLLLPALLFVRDRNRIFIGAFISSVALFIWALVYNVDRNLQVFMPVMICVTGALIIKIWRQSRVARWGLVPLVALQVVWGGDALFYSSYSRIDSAMALIRSGYDGTAKTRFDSYRSSFRALHDALPDNARVLLHNAHPNLGIDREIYLGWVGYQGLISYDALHTPAELQAYFKRLGITHLLYDPDGFRAATKQQEILWNALIAHAPNMGRFGAYKLLRMPETPLRTEPPFRVGVIRLNGYADGIYPIEALNTDEYLPGELQSYQGPALPLAAEPAERAKQLEGLSAVLVGRSERLSGPVGDLLHRQFERTLAVDPFTLYLRK
jgi:hypothetical protein